jgi:hypothetical protein
VILFDLHAVTCVRIRTTTSYWHYVLEVKHPESFSSMSSETAVNQVKEALSEPEGFSRRSSILPFTSITGVFPGILPVWWPNT